MDVKGTVREGVVWFQLIQCLVP